METVTYDQFRGELYTGDIVLFSRKNVLMVLWQWITDCRWTHVGMVMRSEDTQQVLLWESTTLSNLQDHFCGIARAGVQAVLLSQRVRTYKGDVAIRKLNCPMEAQAKRLMDAKLCKFRKVVQNRPFERNFSELLQAFIDFSSDQVRTRCKRSARHTDRSPETETDFYRGRSWSSLFCSELVAAAYQSMGLLDPYGKKANEYTPKDFSSSGPPLHLAFGASLEEEKRIVMG